jgi:hypothetical protein
MSDPTDPRAPGQPAERAANQPAERAANQPAERAANQPAEPAVPGSPTKPPGPANRYELFLDVARDLPRVRTAYDAELLVSTMLGAAYAIAPEHRAAVIADTAAGLRRHLARRRSRPAVLLRAVLAALVPPAARTRPPAMAEPPAWLPHVGAVTCTGTYAFGDNDGEQVTYLACFAYRDSHDGGPEHVVAALVDHGLGAVKDLFVAAPAGALLAQLEAAASTDETMRLGEVGPAELRAAVERYLAVTDELRELPEARSLTSDRALAAHRLRQLPQAQAVPQPTLDDFYAAPEAARLAGADDESLAFCLKLVLGYAAPDPLRWNPDRVEEFLIRWLPERALLDATDTALLPTVLSAWTRWAGRVSGGTPRGVAETVAAIARHRDEFTRRIRSGEYRGPAARATAQLLADGVDLTDERALADWLAAYNAREA